MSKKDSLIKVLKEDAEKHDIEWFNEQSDNLIYAVEYIRPSNHQELAFVVACGLQVESFEHIVDEFVRRRTGGKVLLPDHPFLAMEIEAVPESQRIIIYKEQIISILLKLTTYSRRYCLELYMRLLRTKYEMDDFSKKDLAEIVCEEYRTQLNDKELGVIYDAILYNIQGNRYYYLCSTLATRAEVLIK